MHGTQGFSFSGLHVKTPLNSKEVMCMREISEYLIIPNMCVSEDVCEINLFGNSFLPHSFPVWSRKNASTGKISIKRAAQEVENPPAKLGAGHIKTSKWNIKALKVSVFLFGPSRSDQEMWMFQKYEIPSRGLTYPTLGKGKSSSKCQFLGDMLVSWRVLIFVDRGILKLAYVK